MCGYCFLRNPIVHFMVSGQLGNVCFTSSLSKCNGHLPFFIFFLISLSFHVSANIRAIPCLSLLGHHSVYDVLHHLQFMCQYTGNKLFSKIFARGMWYRPVGRGHLRRVEENVCSQTFLIMYPSSCLEFLGSWWPSRWFPCWCFDVSAYCPCIVRETSRIVIHMQNLDHWGEIQTLYVFLSNFALSHMAFPLDTTSVHSLTTTAVNPNILVFFSWMSYSPWRWYAAVFIWTFRHLHILNDWNPKAGVSHQTHATRT